MVKSNSEGLLQPATPIKHHFVLNVPKVVTSFVVGTFGFGVVSLSGVYPTVANAVASLMLTLMILLCASAVLGLWYIFEWCKFKLSGE